jgi:hypothetical protein
MNIAPVQPVFRCKYTAKAREKVLSRYAAVFDAICEGQYVTEGALDGRVVNGLKLQGFITEHDPRATTPLGLAWRAGYTGPIAPRETVTVKPATARKRTLTVKYGRELAAQERADNISRQLIGRGLLFVHKKMLEHLGMECFYLWSYSRTHPELTTVEQLAAAVHWSLSDTSIRAERCGDRGYPLALKQEDAA